MSPIKKSERAGYGTGARGAQTARRAARAPKAAEWDDGDNDPTPV